MRIRSFLLVLVAIFCFGIGLIPMHQLQAQTAEGDLAQKQLPDPQTRLPKELVDLVRISEQGDCTKIDPLYALVKPGAFRVGIWPKEAALCYGMRTMKLQKILQLLEFYIPQSKAEIDSRENNPRRLRYLALAAVVMAEFVNNAMTTDHDCCISCRVVVIYTGEDKLRSDFGAGYTRFLENLDKLQASAKALASNSEPTRDDIIDVVSQMEGLVGDLSQAAFVLEDAALWEWEGLKPSESQEK